jgi:hypothetical protein
MTVDSETGHFCEDLRNADEGPHATPEAAFLANVQTARDWFDGTPFVYCNASRRIVRRERRVRK